MAIRDLFWACPICGAVGAVRRQVGGRDGCEQCGTAFRRGRGSHIVARQRDGAILDRPAVDWAQALGRPSVESLAAAAPDGRLRDRASVREVDGRMSAAPAGSLPGRPVYYDGDYIGRVERFGKPVEGVLELSRDGLSFEADGKPPRHWPLSRICSVGASSTTLKLAVEQEPLRSIRLSTGSLRLWEELIEALLRTHVAARACGPVLEFQPRVFCLSDLRRRRREDDDGDRAGRAARVHPQSGTPPAGSGASRAGPPPRTEDTPKREGNALYRVLQRLVPPVTRGLAGPLHVIGRQHIPRSGPFLLVPNHQSFIDPVIVQAVCPRPVYTMAKSSEFSAALIGPLMPWLLSFPAHRFQVDAQVVRRALRMLEAGHGVSIYPEGERSWDGRLQLPRLGTLRLILKAGVPVIPCAIQGSYDVLPRWDHAIRRGSIRVTFAEPVRFPRVPGRAERERALGDVAQELNARMASLLGQQPPALPPGLRPAAADD